MADILLLHPGVMGTSIGAALRSAGHQVFWLPGSRSEATRQRAESQDLVALDTLETGIDKADFVLSICPPASAMSVAREVHATGIDTIFVDCNAIAPSAMAEIASMLGNSVLDGCIVGPPARRPDETRLYVSGPHATSVEELFSGSLVACRAISASVGDASALKMCYAGYTKGSAALILALRAAARHYRVEDSLVAEWNHSIPGLAERSIGTARGSARKAWRFEGEMLEIAKTLSDAGLPAGFHQAAAEIFGRLGLFKDRSDASLGEVMDALVMGG